MLEEKKIKEGKEKTDEIRPYFTYCNVRSIGKFVRVRQYEIRSKLCLYLGLIYLCYLAVKMVSKLLDTNITAFYNNTRERSGA
jgi:hypothetical protein